MATLPYLTLPQQWCQLRAEYTKGKELQTFLSFTPRLRQLWLNG